MAGQGAAPYVSGWFSTVERNSFYTNTLVGDNNGDDVTLWDYWFFGTPEYVAAQVSSCAAPVVGLVTSGVCYALPPLAAPADNNVTIDKWQQPFSRPGPSAPLVVSRNSYVPQPIAVQAVTVTLDWMQPPSRPLQSQLRTFATGSTFIPPFFYETYAFGVPVVFNEVLPPRPPIQVRQPYVPQEITVAVTAFPEGWQQPPSRPQQSKPGIVATGSSFVSTFVSPITPSTVPLNPSSTIVLPVPPVIPARSSYIPQPFGFDVTIEKWGQPPSRPKFPDPLILSWNSYQPQAIAFVDNTVTIEKWGQPFSRPLPPQPMVQPVQSWGSFSPPPPPPPSAELHCLPFIMTVGPITAR